MEIDARNVPRVRPALERKDRGRARGERLQRADGHERRASHALPLATPGIPPNPLPPVISYTKSGLYLVTNWEDELRCAGSPCDCYPPCPWRAGMGELFESSSEAWRYARRGLEDRYARGAPPSGCISHVVRIDIDALPLREFPLLSSAEAITAIDQLAHGGGEKPWWAAAKSEDGCGAFLMPLPGVDGRLLVVFRRFEKHLIRSGSSKRMGLSI